MKTITMYELLGLIKDGKAPKKIKVLEWIYTLSDTSSLYYDKDGEELFDVINLCKCLNDEVEILEEEKKIPEKLPKSVTDNACSSKDMRLIAITINQLIDYLKSKGEQ